MVVFRMNQLAPSNVSGLAGFKPDTANLRQPWTTRQDNWRIFGSTFQSIAPPWPPWNAGDRQIQYRLSLGSTGVGPKPISLAELLVWANCHAHHPTLPLAKQVLGASTSPGWSAVTYNAFTTTDFIRIGSTLTSMSAIPTAISVKTIGFANIASTPLYPEFDNDRLVLAATNMGEALGVNSAVLSSRLPLAATNMGEPPGLNTEVLSTSLAFIPNNFSILPDIPIRAIEKFGINYSQTLNPIPYQFWG